VWINICSSRINRLFLLAVYKNTDQTVLKQWGIERFTYNVYTGSLLTWATFSPQKPLGIPLGNQQQITQHKHQRGDLEPFKNTHPLWNTNTTSQNTLWLYTPVPYSFTNMNWNTSKNKNDYTWYKRITGVPIPLLTNAKP